MSEAIVDIQGFKKAFNEFVLKEFAITSLLPDENGEVPQRCIIFDEPFEEEDLPRKYQKMNNWLTTHYHGIAWDAFGDYKYEDITQTLEDALRGVNRVYVKGAEKKAWLRQYINMPCLVIENLEDLGCPKVDDLREGDSCHNHLGYRAKSGNNQHYVCALRNVVHLKAWYAKYHSGCIEKSLKTFCEVRELYLMSAEDIQHLPKYFILQFANSQIDEAWDMLPVKLQRDPEVMGYRRCTEHWNKSGDQIEGPLPYVKDCALCQLNYQ